MEEKKYNFIQNIKINRCAKKIKKEMPFEEFLNLPEYIKEDGYVISTAIKHYSDEQLKMLPLKYIGKLYSVRGKNWFDFIISYPEDEIYDFLIETKPSINENNAEQYLQLVNKLIYFNSDYENILENLKFSNSIIQNLLDSKNPEFIDVLPYKLQEQYILDKDNRKELLKYIKIENLEKFIKKDIDLFKYLDNKSKINLIENNNEIFKLLDDKTKLEVVSLEPKFYNLLDQKLKYFIKNNYHSNNNSKMDEHIFAHKIVINLLKQDIKNIRMFNTIKIDAHFIKIFDDIQSKSDNEIIDLILHSKFTSAIGKLSSGMHILHGTGSEANIYTDYYDTSQVEMFKKLNTEQISKLIRIDVNYILPYITGEEDIDNLTQEETIKSKEKVKEIFTHMYGMQKYSEYEKYIDIIFKLQQSVYEKIKKGHTMGALEIGGSDLYKLLEEIPLHEFKLIFNKAIIDKCSIEQINAYFEAKLNGKDASEEFKNIIETAYGTRARNILESRKQLNIHSINSLEIFDSRILDAYGEAFVHDCISYNIHNFSEFLDIIKDPEKSELFHSYYNILTSVYGENVETIQKAISEYSYYDELLKNIKNVDLDEKQKLNLINVLCSVANHYDINTLEELNNFDKIANEKMMEEINEEIECGNIKNKITMDKIRNIICRSIFYIDYDDIKNIDYKPTLEKILELYDFKNESLGSNEYTEEEIKIMQIIQFIKDSEIDELIAFAHKLSTVPNIRNIVAIQSVIEKVKEKQIEKLNGNLLSIEKLNEICEKEKGKDEPGAWYEEIDGVPIYHLSGVPYMLFKHDSNLSYDDIVQYEGQGGNSAICTRIITNGGKEDIDNSYLYGQIQYNKIISFSNRDANTTHTPKTIIASGTVGTHISNPNKLDYHGNEVAFYRRYRDHKMVSNETGGGRILPLAVGANESSYEDKVKEFKGKGIPIIVLHRDKYKKTKENIQENEVGGKSL